MAKAKKYNRKRKVDKIWEKIFIKENILKNIDKFGYYKISSRAINNYENAEARLLTKFDYWDSLPYIFQKNKLNILPIKRGEYVISYFNAYHPLNIDKNIKPKKITFPHWIETLNYKNLSSEAKVLNCAFVSGILENVLEEKVVPTVDGRMSTESWSFYIDSIVQKEKMKIKNDRSQCQIDGGYEGLNKFAIIEAKNSISKDFIVRQIYYPYRLWHKKIKSNKDILPIYLVFSNGVFHFLIYQFKNVKEYNSLELITQKSYVIKEKPISLEDIENIMRKVEFVKEPTNVPFPQADSFERVIDLIEEIYNNPLNIEEISLYYDFDYRQGQYYSSAGRYLGLLKKINGVIKLTKTGKNILDKKKREKYLSIAEKILEHKVFWQTLEKYIKSGKPPTKNEIFNDIMKKNREFLYKSGGGNLSNSTLQRRASTVKGWVNWILSLQDIV